MITPNGGVFGRNPKFNTVTTQGGIVAGAASSIAGNLTVTSGNIVPSSGNGIDFSADGSAAGMTSELLDDYEEGTWTPLYRPTSGAYTTITMDVIAGSATYVKVGNVVTVSAFFRTDAFTVGTGTGLLGIGGIPFNPAGSSGNQACAGVVSVATGWPASRAPTAVEGAQGSNFLYVKYRAASDGNMDYVAAGDLNNGANQNSLCFTITYRTA